MRSHLVFSAAVRTPNRYMLCRSVSLLTRHLTDRRDSFADRINSCLLMSATDSHPLPGRATPKAVSLPLPRAL